MVITSHFSTQAAGDEADKMTVRLSDTNLGPRWRTGGKPTSPRSGSLIDRKRVKL